MYVQPAQDAEALGRRQAFLSWRPERKVQVHERLEQLRLP